MTKLAPLITGFLRDYMPRQRGYSPQSCETYAFSFKLLFNFTAKRLGTRPSQLTIEDLDAPLIASFLDHLQTGDHPDRIAGDDAEQDEHRCGDQPHDHQKSRDADRRVPGKVRAATLHGVGGR